MGFFAVVEVIQFSKIRWNIVIQCTVLFSVKEYYIFLQW